MSENTQSGGLRIPRYVQSVVDANGAVLLDTRQGKYYALNTLGVEVWTRLERGCSSGEIATDLATRYRVPVETTIGDVGRFLAWAVDSRLVDVDR
jgi:hypothetical protein